MNGYFPEYEIDHINGVRDDNRIVNLRHVSKVCNLQNCTKSKNNTSSFPGVCWHKAAKKWWAQAKVNNIGISLGYFNDPLDAALARHNFEVVDSRWVCNDRKEINKAIKAAWTEFACA